MGDVLSSTSKTPSPVPAPDLGSDNGCRDAPNEITPVQDEITPVQENIAPALGVHASASNDQDAVSVNEPLGRLRPRLELGNSSPYFINSPYPGWTPPWGDYTPYQGSMNVPIPINGPSRSYDELPLADNVCELMYSREFQHDWMITHNVDPAELKTFTSPKKLEQLIAKGVIKIGDAFVVAECCLEHDHDHSSSNVIKLATILSLDKNGYPNLRVERDTVVHSELKGCHGPTNIVKAFNELEPKNHHKAGKAWTDLQVYRGGYWVESLWYLRNSYHLWEEEKQKWIHRVEGTIPKEYTGKRAWNRRR